MRKGQHLSLDTIERLRKSNALAWTNPLVRQKYLASFATRPPNGEKQRESARMLILKLNKDPDFQKKKSQGMKNSEKYKKSKRETALYLLSDPVINQKRIEGINRAYKDNPEYRKKLSESARKHPAGFAVTHYPRSPEGMRKFSEKIKWLWANSSEYREKVYVGLLNANTIRPTRPEIYFQSICKDYDLPFKYTGDRSFWIRDKPSINPDFISTDKRKYAIEIWGIYWHTDEEFIVREQIFNKHGWKVIKFTDIDLKILTKDEIVNKVKSFYEEDLYV